MEELIINVAGGILVAVLSAAGGFFVKSKFFQEKLILPQIGPQNLTRSYSHLSGKWYLYWLSYDQSNPTQPVWMQGIQELRVDKNTVSGTTEFINHPILSLGSVAKGEIRAGKMIIIDTYIGDDTEFASIIYPNLRSKALLVGIWSGLDNLLRPVSAPAILSRNEMGASELNKVVAHSTIYFIQAGEYDFASLTPA